MLSWRQVRSLTVKIAKKPRRRLTCKQITMLADEVFGENQDQSRLAAFLTLSDEIEWLADNEPRNVEALLTIVRERAMREWYNTWPVQEAMIQMVRNSFRD